MAWAGFQAKRRRLGLDWERPSSMRSPSSSRPRLSWTAAKLASECRSPTHRWRRICRRRPDPAAIFHRTPLTRRHFMTEINKDEKVVVAKSDVAAKADFNVANVIAAIALLLVVLGGLKYFGVSPI